MGNIIRGIKRFGQYVGIANTELILFVFYFLIFTPFGMFARIFRRNPLIKPISETSNWQDSDRGVFDPIESSHQS
ncbi:MAG: hypothetical protein ABIJ45_01885 [Candidatus Zixiibacteriota bacterium]